MPQGKTVYTDAVIQRMHELSRVGTESIKAYETLLRENLLPRSSKLTTFRSRSSELGIKWGGKQEGRIVSFHIPHEDFEKLYAEALSRQTTPGVLARKLICTIVRDAIYTAVLDDKETDK